MEQHEQQQQQSQEQKNVADSNSNTNITIIIVIAITITITITITINSDLQSPSTYSVSTGSIPSPHQQTFKTNDSISLLLSKTLFSKNTHTGSGGTLEKDVELIK